MPRSAKKRKKTDSSSSSDVHKTPSRSTSGKNSESSTPSPVLTHFNKTPESSMYTSRVPSFGFGFKSPSENQFISPSQMVVHRDIVWQDTTAEECKRRLKAREGRRTPPIKPLSSTTPKRKLKNRTNAQLMEKLQIMSRRIAEEKEEEEKKKSQVNCEDSLFEDDWEEDPDIDFFASTIENEATREEPAKKEDSDSDIFDDDFIDDAVLQCTQELEKKCESPTKPSAAPMNGSKPWQQTVSVNDKDTQRYDVNRQWQTRARGKLSSNNQQTKVTETDVRQTTGNPRNTKQSYPVSKRETPSRNCKNATTSYQYTSRSSTGVPVKKLNTPNTKLNTVPIHQLAKPSVKPANNGRNFEGLGIQTRQQTVNRQSCSFSALGQSSRARAVPPPSVQQQESESDKDDSLMDDEDFMSSLISTLEQVDRDLL